MSRSIHRPLAACVFTASAVLLAGCSSIQGMVGGVEPERDAATGEVTEAAQANAFALRVGDCLTLNAAVPVSEETQAVESVPTTPCAEEHDSEIYAADLMDGGEYPGDEAVATAADDFCYSTFQRFVELAYEDSTLDYTTMFPTQDSWEMMDDREILCVVVDPAGGVTGTLEGAQY